VLLERGPAVRDAANYDRAPDVQSPDAVSPPLSLVVSRIVAEFVPCPAMTDAAQLLRLSTLQTIELGVPPAKVATKLEELAKSVLLDVTDSFGVIETAGGGPDEYADFSTFAASRMCTAGTVRSTFAASLMWIAATDFRTLEASRSFIS
jgi:hypothetical protein